MQKPIGFDEAKEFQEFKRLPKGGYICRILKLEEAKSKNGNDMIVVYLDIADGEFKGYYMNRYENDTRDGKKWGCVYRQVVLDTTTQKTSSGFKGFITSVEESNAGFVNANIWNDDFTKYFKGKNVGCIFADEHYYNSAGEERVVAKPHRICSIEKIKKGDFKIPNDIMPDSNSNITGGTAGTLAGFSVTEISEDDLPF